MRARGFTLIEISVVLVITAVTLTLAGPGLARLYARLQFNAQLGDLEAGISALPRLAYALGEEGNLDDLALRHLDVPQGWQLAGAEQIFIRSNGICGGGRLRVLTPGGERELNLVPPFCTVERRP